MSTDNNADIVVLTALDSEYDAVCHHLTNVAPRTHPSGTIFEVGTASGGAGRVAAAVIGAGNVGAAVLVERAINMFQPAALFFVGVAGALHDDLRLGDVVVATKVYAYHGGREHDGGFAARPRAYEAPHELEQLARHIARTGRWRQPAPTVHFRPIAAGEVVLNSRDAPLAQQLARHYDDAAAIEMESAGVAQAGHLNRALPVLTVRSISDHADRHKYLADGEGSQPRAARHAAAFAFDLIGEFLSGRAGRPTASPGPARPALAAGPRWPAGTTGTTSTAIRPTTTEVRTPQPGPTPGVPWQPLPQPAEVTWRTDRSRRLSTVENSAVELHLVPVETVDRIEVRRLASLADDLATAGRHCGLFTAAQALTVASDDRSAWATNDEYRSGPAGLVVERFGPRSVWQPLPHDNLGAVLDESAVGQWLTQMLGLLTSFPLPSPDRYAPAVGIDPVQSVSLGRVSDLPRTQAMMGWSSGPHVRVPADESVPAEQIRQHAPEVAEELAARLVQAFRRSRR